MPNDLKEFSLNIGKKMNFSTFKKNNLLQKNISLKDGLLTEVKEVKDDKDNVRKNFNL